MGKPALAVTFGAAVALLLGSAWLARSGQVSDLEADIFGWINGLPESWRPVMYGLQLLGVLVVPLGLAAVAAAVGRWRLAVALALIVPIRDYVNLNVASSSVKGLRYDARGWFPILVDVEIDGD